MSEGAEGRLGMPAEEMRRLGYRVIDRLVDRWERLPEEPVWRGGSRSELEPLLREAPPEEGRDPDAVLDRAIEEILERAGRIDHPRFGAFVPSSPSWPTVLADLLTSGFNIFQGTWLESAGPSQAELVVIDWFREWLGMPEGAGGTFTSGGSAANLVAVVTARVAAGNPERPAIYFSAEGHSSLERAARIAGIGEESHRLVECDADFRMRLDRLREAIRSDREAGRTPVAVCANAGTTNTGAVDPLPELVELCRAEGVWLHVDGAYGGFSVLTEEGRAALAGIGEVDSVTLDPHKWLFQTYEAGCLLVREPARLTDAFRVFPDYLQDTFLGEEEVNFGDRGLQLTRSFRALKVWLSVQMHGLRAFRDAVQGGIDRARLAENTLRESGDVEILAAATLGIVCFRFRPDGPGSGNAEWTETELESLNRTINDRLLESGYAMMSSTRIHGRWALRLCPMNHRTRDADVIGICEAVVREGRAIVRGRIAEGRGASGPAGGEG